MTSELQNISEIYLISYFGPKALVATLCGIIVGWEREMKSKVAGIRTNVLICVGACILSAFSFLIADYYQSDPTRIVGQIITGVGFLGGGVILKINDRLTGVTTASFIWVMCAIGICCGAGFVLLPIILTIGLIIISIFFHYVERKIETYVKSKENV